MRGRLAWAEAPDSAKNDRFGRPQRCNHADVRRFTVQPGADELGRMHWRG